MSERIYGDAFGGNAAENYQRYFVPCIGAPVARDLVAAARLSSGERVLDVGCGTGVVTRLAAESVGPDGGAAGLDVNPGMLAVARQTPANGRSIDWYESSADAIPLPDDAFDVVLCQMSLQFMDDQIGALREMRRVLAPGGRLLLSVPGPTPPLFARFADGLARHVDPEIGGFVHHVFSLDADSLRALASEAGFEYAETTYETKTLTLPEPKDFLWQYIHSTPIAGRVTEGDDQALETMQEEICASWEPFVSDDGMTIEVGISTLVCRG